MRSPGLILCATAVAIAAGFGPLHSLARVMVALYPPSLRILQAAVDQNISARLWDRILLPALSWPARISRP